MTQTLQNGIDVPTNSDPYSLTDDLAAAFLKANVVIPVAGSTQRDNLTGKFSGMVVCRLDVTGLPLEIWDGTIWHRYSRSYAKAAGTANIGVVGAGALTGPFAQTFPAGRFTVAPIVTVTTDQTRLIAVAAAVTATGFDLYLQNVTTAASGNGQLRWAAEQMTPTTAAG